MWGLVGSGNKAVGRETSSARHERPATTKGFALGRGGVAIVENDGEEVTNGGCVLTEVPFPRTSETTPLVGLHSIDGEIFSSD